MKELSNYELCLLIFLRYKQDKIVFHGGLHPKAQEYCKVWIKLQDTVNACCKDTAIKVIEPTEPIGTAISNNTQLIIQVKNKVSLEKFLEDYSEYIAQDSLDSYHDEIKFEILAKEFKNSIDKNKKYTEYYIDTTKYIPIILWGMSKGYILVKELSFQLFPSEEVLERMHKIELKRKKLGSNDFEFSMTADISKFMNVNIRKHRCENGDKDNSGRDSILEPQDWKMYLCICYVLQTNPDIEKIGDVVTINREIFLERKVYTENSEKKARSLFNKRVRNNIPDIKGKPYLLKLNKDDSKYDVNIKLLQAFTNQTKIKPQLIKGLADSNNFCDALKYDYQKFTNGK